MNRRLALGATLAFALMLPAAAGAHEGHPHKIMGTVSARHENHLEVKAVDGKIVSIALNDKTKIVRGNSKVAASDIQAGERIVVTAMQTKEKDGSAKFTATEIRLPGRDAGADR